MTRERTQFDNMTEPGFWEKSNQQNNNRFSIGQMLLDQV